MKKLMNAIYNHGETGEKRKAINTIVIEVSSKEKSMEDVSEVIAKVLKNNYFSMTQVDTGYEILYCFEESCIIFEDQEEEKAEFESLKKLLELELNCSIEVFGRIDIV